MAATGAALLGLMLWTMSTALYAISPAELEQFRQLSPEQRRAAMEMLRGEGGNKNADDFAAGPGAVRRTPQGVHPARKEGSGGDRQPGVDFGGRSRVPPRRAPAGTGQQPPPVGVTAGQRQEAGPKGTLRRFGDDLFTGGTAAFSPAEDVPVPDGYVIGPGDTLLLQLYGKVDRRHRLAVSREGDVLIPNIGPVAVAGLTFRETKQLLRKRIGEKIIGARTAITMGRLHRIQIFVLGEVRHPGAYMVSPFTTMVDALFRSGGVTSVGSLRKIELKRRGHRIARLDLYDLLLRGDTGHDANLRPGDAIFVPPVGATVGVSGEVKRPAIYEIRGEKTVGEILKLAGGLLPTAYAPASQLLRIDERGQRTLVDLDLTRRTGLGFRIRNGDLLRIRPILDRLDDFVDLSGHVQRPGKQAWRKGIRLTDLLPSPTVLKPRADLNYLLIRRELPPDRRIKVLAANLEEALAHPDSPRNPRLEPRDRIFVFEQGKKRRKLIGKLLRELKAQAGAGRPARIVTAGGHVRVPGEYPLLDGMRIDDLIRAAGGLSESAYTLRAEMTRYEVVDKRHREIEHLTVDLAAILSGNHAADILLRPHDNLQIKKIPEWEQTAKVEIKGEVRFPGVYPITRGEQLSSLLRRAGGLTDFAFPEGAVFMRESLRRKEKKQLDTLADRLQSDLASTALENAQGDAKQQSTLEIGRALIKQLRETKPVGRLVIDLPRLLATSRQGRVSDYDVTLKQGDKIVIPKLTQEITVIGEVFHPTSHLYTSGLDVDDYIKMSGGATRKADTGNIYVVRANGAVVTRNDLGDAPAIDLFETTENKAIRPGDTIVVPLEIDRIRPLTFWTNVSQIAYQIGIAVAAANAVGIF